MAGNYPDVPAPRMAYDRDGSVGFYASSDGTSVGQCTAAQLLTLNDESAGDAFSTIDDAASYYIGLIFPQFRDIAGFTVAGTDSQSRDFQVSVDTTNGYDGTWTTAQAGFFPVGNSGSYLRTGIITLSSASTAVKAVRVGQAAGIDNFHVYGSISTGQSPDRLRFWHPTSNTPLNATPAYFDFGEVTRGQAETRQFRIKNVSSTRTASGVAVSLEALTDASPSLVPQFLFSISGTPVSSLLVGDLPPGTTSPVITVNRATDASAALGLWTARIIAVATSWA